MKNFLSRKNLDRYEGALTHLFLIFLIWGISIIGGFKILNGVSYDLLVQLTPNEQVASSRIIALEAAPEMRNAGDEVWSAVLQEIEKFDVNQIVFTFFPKNASEAFYEAASNSNKVIFGHEVELSPEDPDVTRLVDIPPQAKPFNFPTGIVTLPMTENAVYRYLLNRFELPGESYKPLEFVIANRLGISTDQYLDKNYYVNFLGKTPIPRMSLERVLNNAAIPEIMNGRVVLIGFDAEGETPGLHTPISIGGNMMLPLLYHGYELETIMEDKAIGLPSIYLNLLLIFIIISGCFIAFQFVNLERALWATFLLGMAFLALTWFTLVFLLFWLPLAEMMIGLIIVLFFTFRQKTSMEFKSAGAMLLEVSSRLEERLLPETFFTSDEHWEKIIVVVNQTLNLRKVIFLERIEGENRLKEIASHNCTFDDIHEMRRDYQRAPYSDAIAANGPLKMDQRMFYKDIREDEDQYIVPLIFSGRVLGFWALVLAQEDIDDIKRFTLSLQDFASQISELLYRREQWRKMTLRDKNELKQVLQFEGGKFIFKELSKTVTVIEKRVAMLENLFDSIETAVMLYDVFGRVLFVNQKMLDLLKAAEIAPYQTSTLELAKKVTSLDDKDIKNLFHELIVNRKSMAVPAVLPGKQEGAYYLGMRPLIHKKDERFSRDALPLEIAGILLELLDYTHMKNINDHKQHLLAHFNTTFESHVNVLRESISQKDYSKQEGDLNALSKLHKETKDQMMTDVFEVGVKFYPVDPTEPLKQAIEEAEPSLKSHSVSIKAEIPPISTLVGASPKLKEVLNDVLTVMINDATEGSEITISAQEKDGWLIYSFKNEGYGVPKDLYQRYIYENEELEFSSSEIARIRGVHKQIIAWGGKLDTSSDVGIGVNVAIYLKTGFGSLQ